MGRNNGGRNFQKGNPGGPGRPPILPELKAVPSLTKETYSKILNTYSSLSRDELQECIKNPNAKSIINPEEKISVLELLVCTILAKGLSMGDQNRLESILNRAIGPVKQEASVEATIKVTVEDYTE